MLILTDKNAIQLQIVKNIVLLLATNVILIIHYQIMFVIKT